MHHPSNAIHNNNNNNTTTSTGGANSSNQYNANTNSNSSGVFAPPLQSSSIYGTYNNHNGNGNGNGGGVFSASSAPSSRHPSVCGSGGGGSGGGYYNYGGLNVGVGVAAAAAITAQQLAAGSKEVSALLRYAEALLSNTNFGLRGSNSSTLADEEDMDLGSGGGAGAGAAEAAGEGGTVHPGSESGSSSGIHERSLQSQSLQEDASSATANAAAPLMWGGVHTPPIAEIEPASPPSSSVMPLPGRGSGGGGGRGSGGSSSTPAPLPMHQQVRRYSGSDPHNPNPYNPAALSSVPSSSPPSGGGYGGGVGYASPGIPPLGPRPVRIPRAHRLSGSGSGMPPLPNTSTSDDHQQQQQQSTATREERARARRAEAEAAERAERERQALALEGRPPHEFLSRSDTAQPTTAEYLAQYPLPQAFALGGGSGNGLNNNGTFFFSPSASLAATYGVLSNSSLYFASFAAASSFAATGTSNHTSSSGFYYYPSATAAGAAGTGAGASAPAELQHQLPQHDASVAQLFQQQLLLQQQHHHHHPQLATPDSGGTMTGGLGGMSGGTGGPSAWAALPGTMSLDDLRTPTECSVTTAPGLHHHNHPHALFGSFGGLTAASAPHNGGGTDAGEGDDDSTAASCSQHLLFQQQHLQQQQQQRSAGGGLSKLGAAATASFEELAGLAGYSHPLGYVSSSSCSQHHEQQQQQHQPPLSLSSGPASPTDGTATNNTDTRTRSYTSSSVATTTGTMAPGQPPILMDRHVLDSLLLQHHQQLQQQHDSQQQQQSAAHHPPQAGPPQGFLVVTHPSTGQLVAVPVPPNIGLHHLQQQQHNLNKQQNPTDDRKQQPLPQQQQQVSSQQTPSQAQAHSPRARADSSSAQFMLVDKDTLSAVPGIQTRDRRSGSAPPPRFWDPNSGVVLFDPATGRPVVVPMRLDQAQLFAAQQQQQQEQHQLQEQQRLHPQGEGEGHGVPAPFASPPSQSTTSSAPTTTAAAGAADPSSSVQSEAVRSARVGPPHLALEDHGAAAVTVPFLYHQQQPHQSQRRYSATQQQQPTPPPGTLLTTSSASGGAPSGTTSGGACSPAWSMTGAGGGMSGLLLPMVVSPSHFISPEAARSRVQSMVGSFSSPASSSFASRLRFSSRISDTHSSNCSIARGFWVPGSNASHANSTASAAAAAAATGMRVLTKGFRGLPTHPALLLEWIDRRCSILAKRPPSPSSSTTANDAARPSSSTATPSSRHRHVSPPPPPLAVDPAADEEEFRCRLWGLLSLDAPSQLPLPTASTLRWTVDVLQAPRPQSRHYQQQLQQLQNNPQDPDAALWAAPALEEFQNGSAGSGGASLAEAVRRAQQLTNNCNNVNNNSNPSNSSSAHTNSNAASSPLQAGGGASPFASTTTGHSSRNGSMHSTTNPNTGRDSAMRSGFETPLVTTMTMQGNRPSHTPRGGVNAAAGHQVPPSAASAAVPHHHHHPHPLSFGPLSASASASVTDESVLNPSPTNHGLSTTSLAASRTSSVHSPVGRALPFQTQIMHPQPVHPQSQTQAHAQTPAPAPAIGPLPSSSSSGGGVPSWVPPIPLGGGAGPGSSAHHSRTNSASHHSPPNAAQGFLPPTPGGHASARPNSGSAGGAGASTVPTSADSFELLVRGLFQEVMTASSSSSAASLSGGGGSGVRNDTVSAAVVLFLRFLQSIGYGIAKEFTDRGVVGPGGRVPAALRTWQADSWVPTGLRILRTHHFNIRCALHACLQLSRVAHDSLRLSSHELTGGGGGGSSGSSSNRGPSMTLPSQQQQQPFPESLKRYRNHILHALRFDIISISPQMYLEMTARTAAAAAPWFPALRKEANVNTELLLQHTATATAPERVAWIAAAGLIAAVFRVHSDFFGSRDVQEAYLQDLTFRCGEWPAMFVSSACAILRHAYEAQAAAVTTAQQQHHQQQHHHHSHHSRTQ